jgi:hypothetical protein
VSYQDLLRSQRNEVFRLIEKMKLTPAEFEWENPPEPSDNLVDIAAINWPKLIHTPTGYYFKFGRISLGSRVHRIQYFPSSELAQETWYDTDGSWKRSLFYFEQWLNIVRREYFEPDLWSTINDKALVTEDLYDFENSTFTIDEQDRISKAITELKSFLISTNRHSSEHIQFIEERLNHLEESSKRLGRKDWITLAMGTLTNIIVGVALAPDAARELIRNAGLLLGWIVGSTHLIP